MDKNLLALFWTLAEGQEQQRIDTVAKLLKILSAKQKQNSDLCEELQYTVKRLVKGLASDRKFARHGYATALTQVLRHFDCVTISCLLKNVKEDLKIAKGDPKSAEDSQVATVVQSLNKIRKDKVLLHQICTNGILQLIAKVSGETMKSIVWPVLEKELSDGWSECEPDTLIILMTVMQYHQDIINKEFLSAHWGSKKLLSEKNYEKIGALMAKSTSEHPVIHPVCTKVLEKSAEKPETLLKFCQKIINESLLHQAIPKKYLCFQLIKSALPHVTTVEQVKVILSENLIGLLMKQLQDKEQPLYTASRELVQQFVSASQTIIDPEVQVTVVLRLLQPPGSVFFDNVTKTTTVTGIVRNLNSGAAERFSDLLMDMILGGNKIGHKATIESEVVIKWAIPMLANMITQVSKATDSDWQLKILQFLFLHGFFQVNTKDKSIPHCNNKMKQNLSLKILHLMQENFFRALNKLATYSPGRGSRYQQHSVSIMQKLVTYVQKLLSSNQVVSPHKVLQDPSLKHWNKVHGILETISVKVRKVEKIGEAQAFEMLFIHLALQLFHEPKAAGEALQDLYVCYEKAFKKNSAKTKPNNSDDEDEPEWIEVVTDVLLSLLSQNSHLLRTVVKTVFTILSPHITSASLQLILDVLKSSGADEESVVDFDDDEVAMTADDNDDAETNSVVSDRTEDTEGSDNESSEDSDSDSADEPEDVDDHLKDSLKAALGKAAPASDAEMSEDDLSDGEMEKLDDVLAAAFKSMRRGKKDHKEKRLQLKHYKMRCLDLIEVLVQGETPTGFLLELLDPMLNLLEDTQKEKDMKDLFNRATSVYRGLVKLKKVVGIDSIEVSALPDVVQDLVTKSTTVTGVPMVCEVGNAVLFVMKVVHEMECNQEPVKPGESTPPAKKQKAEKVKGSENMNKVYSILRKALQDYCKRRDSLLNHMLFTVMLDKQPVLMWPLITDLLDLAQDESVRIFCRTHVCSMVAALLNKNTVSMLAEENWQECSRRIIVEYLKMFDKATEQNNKKQKFLHDVLVVLHKVFQLTSDLLVQELVPETLLKTIEKVKEGSNKNKDMKTICNKVSSVVSKRLKSSSVTEPKVSKKRSLDNGHEPSIPDQKKIKKDALDLANLELTDTAVNNLKLVADQKELKIKKNKQKQKKQEEMIKIAKMNSKKAKKMKNNKLKKKNRKAAKALPNGDASDAIKVENPSDSGVAKKKKKKKSKKESVETS